MLATKSPKTVHRRSTLAEQAKALSVVLREEFGMSFTFYDASTGNPSGHKDSHDGTPPLEMLSAEEVLEFIGDQAARIQLLPNGSYQVALALYDGGKRVLVAVATIASVLPNAGRRDLSAQECEQTRLLKWLQSFGDRLRLANQFLGRSRDHAADDPQAGLAWQTILTLDQLMRSLRIHKDAPGHHKRILQAAFELLRCQALVWVPAQPTQSLIAEGEVPISAWDCRQLAGLLDQADSQKTGLLICDAPAETSWGKSYPQITNLLGMVLSESHAGGWILAMNKEGQPFRQRDAALLTSFIALLDLHLRATTRYADLKELLVGLTRSLTCAIDAKDSYTYGHSERVARIAVQLGRELELQEEELSDIYLAGLLHDIGKIGVRDDILLKRGPLTPDEFEHVKQHVTIGYKILADLRPIRSLLPGVLYHHERYDGKGYPDGLVGENIPLLARILAVADAYDAMSTARPYRNAMPFRQVEEILRQGAGVQWDKHLVEAFMRCRDKIHAIRERGVGDSLNQALDGALRNEESSRAAPGPRLRPAP
jgi:hypothetical protein